MLSSSFYKILLINPFEFNLDFFKTLKNIEFDLIIFTHSDNLEFEKACSKVVGDLSSISWNLTGPIEPIGSGPIGANKTGPLEPIVSGPIGASLYADNDLLVDLIKTKINNKYLELVKDDPILIDRHLDLINRLYLDVCDYSDLCGLEKDISIISSELNNMGHCISELIGIVSPDDVLHNIFTNFCIGK